MLERLQSEWFFFQFFGLLPDQAETIAWRLPAMLTIAGLFLGLLWLGLMWFWRYEDWRDTAAGYASLAAFVLALETGMFKPVIAWLLMGTHRPGFLWVLTTYPEECLALAIVFPLWHGFVFHAYRGEILTWLFPYRYRW